MKERNTGIDILKGIAIICVVVGHLDFKSRIADVMIGIIYSFDFAYLVSIVCSIFICLFVSIAIKRICPRLLHPIE